MRSSISSSRTTEGSFSGFLISVDARLAVSFSCPGMMHVLMSSVWFLVFSRFFLRVLIKVYFHGADTKRVIFSGCSILLRLSTEVISSTAVVMNSSV